MRPSRIPKRPRAATSQTPLSTFAKNRVMKVLLSFASKHVHAALVNYKTTLSGVALIAYGASVVIQHVAGIAEDSTAVIDPDQLQFAWGEIIAGIGLITARDQDKSSQETGVRK